MSDTLQIRNFRVACDCSMRHFIPRLTWIGPGYAWCGEGVVVVVVNARGVTGAGELFTPLVIERRELGPHDVLIDIVYSGICHSDVHRVNGQSGGVTYPMVPGHEIAG